MKTLKEHMAISNALDCLANDEISEVKNLLICSEKDLNKLYRFAVKHRKRLFFNYVTDKQVYHITGNNITVFYALVDKLNVCVNIH